MCQAKPGPRCWSDSKARAKSLAERLTKAESELSKKRSEIKKAASAGDFSLFDRLRKQEEKLIVRVSNLQAEVALNQRDMDGTKTGQKVLNELIAATTDPEEVKRLMLRRSQAEAMRDVRVRALQLTQSNHVPLLRIAS